MVSTSATQTSHSETRSLGEGSRLFVWRAGEATERHAPILADVEEALTEPAARLWLDLLDPSDEDLAAIAALLGLHPLIASEIAADNKRPKMVQVEDALHVLLFALSFEGEVHTVEIDAVIGKRYLLTAHGAGWDPLSAPMLSRGAGPVLGRGPDYLFYTLADSIVDGYFPVLDHLAEGIDELQDDVIAQSSSWTLDRLFDLKRELIELRRATSPAREVFNQLTNRDLGLIARSHIVYYRDIYDHLLRVSEEIDNYRELVSGTLDVYLTSVNNELSRIMKRLTGVTVLLAGVGAIGGIFGMSQATPAMAGQEGFGFYFLTAATIALAAVGAMFLRRIDWI
jgi:magnesium transporter